MNFKNAPIAVTDLETTGVFSFENEIIEIGLVLVDQKTFEIIDTLNIKIKPEHPERIHPEAVARNGYTTERWHDAVSLQNGIEQYVDKTKDAIFASYNVSFDWPFILQALCKTGFSSHMNNKENHDRLDLLTLAWSKGLKNSPSLSLKSACEMFDVLQEPLPHSALNGAMTAYELFRKLCAIEDSNL